MRHCPFYFSGKGVPPAIIYDSAKEMIFGKFNRKLKEALCHLRQTEQFSPCWNAERKMKELKKSSGRKLIKSGTSKRLWYDYIRSTTAHGIYKLDGEVPEKIMYKETFDKSQFCEFELFEWVMF